MDIDYEEYEENVPVRQKVLLLAEKETFLIRVLENKIREAGFAVEFAQPELNVVSRGFETADLITYYMDNGEVPPSDVMQFLSDRLQDSDKQFIPIGEPVSIEYITERLLPSLIFQKFVRPLDNAEYIKAINTYFKLAREKDRRKTILIVDDDAGFLGLIREWLKGSYKVAMATSGLQAIKWLGKNKADLILLDYEMPVTNGPQVLEMLRSDPDTRSIPVIFLTARNDKKSVMSVMGLKPEGYFLKNIDMLEILDNLKKFFEEREGGH